MEKEKQIEFTATTLLTLGMVEVAIPQNPHLFLKLLVGKLFLPIPENSYCVCDLWQKFYLNEMMRKMMKMISLFSPLCDKSILSQFKNSNICGKN